MCVKIPEITVAIDNIPARINAFLRKKTVFIQILYATDFLKITYGLFPLRVITDFPIFVPVK